MEFWSYLRDALSPGVLRTYRCWRETEVPFAAASGFFLHLSFVGSLFHVKEQSSELTHLHLVVEREIDITQGIVSIPVP